MWTSLPLRLILIAYFKIVAGDESLNPFLKNIINEWKLQSPTVLTKNELPTSCMSHRWILCLTNNLDLNELTGHLVMLDKRGRQDGVILIGNQYDLIEQLHSIAPAMFRSNYPMFLPLKYSTLISLRLDSNVIFYEQQGPTFRFVDMFSVKGGQPISSELGTWDMISGFKPKQKKHRWDRRTDLNGANIVNNLGDYGSYSRIIRDDQGKVVRSQGELQNLLFYIAEALNATIMTTESLNTGTWKKLKNGSWTGGIGVLQRMEADICR